MRPPSRQILSVEETFGRNGWHCELVEGRDVIRAVFSAHHTRVILHAQSFTELNALSVVAESPLHADGLHLAATLELLAHANKQLTLGSFELDLDRDQLVFRISNVFEREVYDKDIITSMIHCAVAELDRITPCAAIVLRTPEDLLEDLDLKRLLQRDDLMPPMPGEDYDEGFA